MPTGHPVPQHTTPPKHVPRCSSHAHVAPQTQGPAAKLDVFRPPRKDAARVAPTPPFPDHGKGGGLSPPHPNKDRSHKPAPFRCKNHFIFYYLLTQQEHGQIQDGRPWKSPEQVRVMGIILGSPAAPQHCDRAKGCDSDPNIPRELPWGGVPH